MFSHVSTYTRNEPGPITTGWDVRIPHGTGLYTGDSSRGIASSLNTDGTTNRDYLAGGKYGLNCAPTGGCTNSQVFPVSAELATLLDARNNPNDPFALQSLMKDDRETFTDVMTYNITTGLEGSIPGTDMTWEAFVNHGESHTFAKQTGIYSLMRTRAVMTAPNFGQGFSYQGNQESGGFGAATGPAPAGSTSSTSRPAGSARTAWKRSVPTSRTARRCARRSPKRTCRAACSRFRRATCALRSAPATASRNTSSQRHADHPGPLVPRPGARHLPERQRLRLHRDQGALRRAADPGAGRHAVLPGAQSRSRRAHVGLQHHRYQLDLQGAGRLGGQRLAPVPRRLQPRERAPNIGELFLSAQQTFGVSTAGDPCSLANPLSWSANPANANGANVQAVCRILMEQSGNPTADEQYYAGVQSPATFGFAFPTLVGNANLEPEKADTWTAGVVLQSPIASGALSRLRLSVDWFDIRVNNAIGAQTWPRRCSSASIRRSTRWSRPTPRRPPRRSSARTFRGPRRATPATSSRLTSITAGSMSRALTPSSTGRWT
jgi:hypothetical protein